MKKEEIKTKIRIISYHAILIGHRTSWGITVEGNVKEKQKRSKEKQLSSQHKKYRHKINGVKKINQKKKKQMVETISLTHRSLGKKKIKEIQTSIRKSHKEKEKNNKHEEGKEKIA